MFPGFLRHTRDIARTDIANGARYHIGDIHCMSAKIPKLIYLDADLEVFIRQRCAALHAKTGEPVSQGEWIRRVIRQAMREFRPTLTDVNIPDDPEPEE
jgi:hypothetical protein